MVYRQNSMYTQVKSMVRGMHGKILLLFCLKRRAYPVVGIWLLLLFLLQPQVLTGNNNQEMLRFDDSLYLKLRGCNFCSFQEKMHVFFTHNNDIYFSAETIHFLGLSSSLLRLLYENFKSKNCYIFIFRAKIYCTYTLLNDKLVIMRAMQRQEYIKSKYRILKLLWISPREVLPISIISTATVSSSSQFMTHEAVLSFVKVV